MTNDTIYFTKLVSTSSANQFPAFHYDIFTKQGDSAAVLVASLPGNAAVTALTASPNGTVVVATSGPLSEELYEVNTSTGGVLKVSNGLPYSSGALSFTESEQLFSVIKRFDQPAELVELNPSDYSIVESLGGVPPGISDITAIGDSIWAVSTPPSTPKFSDIEFVQLTGGNQQVTLANPQTVGPNSLLTGSDGNLYIKYSFGPAYKFDLGTQQLSLDNSYDVSDSGPTASSSFGAEKSGTDDVQFGTELADTLFGNPDPNVLVGLDGDDALISFEGNDVLIGDTGNDSLDGGSGNDQLFGGDGNDFLFAGEGDDALFGGIGDDVLVGDASGTTGNDGIFGENGNDIAYGGLGSDYIDGGNDADALYGETGNDEIIGGNGNDFISGGSDNDLIYAGNGDDIVLGGSENDTIFGESGNDIIDGGTGSDAIFGGLGNDLIFAGEGFAGDVLFGEDGDDVIRGGNGSDYIVAGPGNDVISGGLAGDFLKLESGSGIVIWQDFENDVDKIDASFSVARSQFNQSVQIASTLDGAGTWIGFADTQIILENIGFEQINQDDFLLVEDGVA